jgi:hypothetical protein
MDRTLSSSVSTTCRSAVRPVTLHFAGAFDFDADMSEVAAKAAP